ncbi:MAG: hypothetical protein EA406_12740 [Rhodospirillales bacterium]|nr:MAG: hypothetical protein EA406_12740 [Rhodospirillales bacterium]
MLNIPRSGQKIFEVAIYNSDVQDLASRHRQHPGFDERWSRPQMRNVVARTESEARDLIAQRFPPEKGFVIQKVCQGRF